MWPLALFYRVYPHTVTLLWLQDFAVVGAELVVVAWAREVLTAQGRTRRDAPWLLGLVTVLVLITPWSWFTIGFDFHFEPFAALFGLLAARDICAGRYRWLMLWVPLTLISCAAAGALIVIAIGAAALLSRGRSRTVAVGVVGVGCAWLALAAGLGAMRFGDLPLSSMYGYLSGHETGELSLTSAVRGFLTDPLAALRMFSSHVWFVAGYVASAGVIGLRSRWGLLPAALVLLPSALNSNTDFIHFAQAFQSWPSVLFLVVGTVMVLQQLGAAEGVPRYTVPFFGLCALVFAASISATFMGTIPKYVERVSGPAARELAEAQQKIPSGAEVIASQGVIGRFGAGHLVHPYWAQGGPEKYRVTARTVVFILAPVQGTAEGYPPETRSSIAYLRDDLHARGAGARLRYLGARVAPGAWHPLSGPSLDH